MVQRVGQHLGVCEPGRLVGVRGGEGHHIGAVRKFLDQWRLREVHQIDAGPFPQPGHVLRAAILGEIAAVQELDLTGGVDRQPHADELGEPVPHRGPEPTTWHEVVDAAHHRDRLFDVNDLGDLLDRPAVDDVIKALLPFLT